MTPSVPLVRGVNCPSCGAAIELRGGAHTLTAVCGNCQSVLDAKDPNLTVLQRFSERAFVEPEIPLGARGTLGGVPWQVIGFQVRTISVDGEEYSWREYLLFNPYRGYRYLTEYDGHWNDVVSIRTLPTFVERARPAAYLGGEEFRHFQTAEARTTFVLGEFPWQVRVGDRVRSRDFIAPPRILSDEATDEETTFSLGTYVEPAVVWDAFDLPGAPRRPVGVFANQPNPYGARARAAWRLAQLFILLLVVLGVARCTMARNEEVFARQYEYRGAQGDSAAFVTAPFDLGGRTSNVAIELWADVDNNALFMDVGLVNTETGAVRDVGREVAEYSGIEDGESWREGSQQERILLPSVPPGRYYLRLRPEGPGPPVDAAFGGTSRPIRYTVRVKRDVPRPGYWLIALAALLLPPVWPVMRSWSFEQSRWQESDYSSGGGGDDEEDDE